MLDPAKRKALVLFGALILAFGAFFLYRTFHAHVSPEISIQVLSSSYSITPELPLTLRPSSTAQVKLSIFVSPHSIRALRLFQDDCIDSALINGAPPRGIAFPFCDFNRGLSLDDEVLIEGSNEVILDIRNNGGPGGLSVETDEKFPNFTLAKVLLILAFLPLVFFGARALREVKPPAIASLVTANWVLFAILLLAAIALRVWWFHFESTDIRNFLAPWIGYIREHQGWRALADEFSDYTPSYLYLLTALSYLPSSMPIEIAIKIPSLLFDLLLAFSIYRIIVLANTNKEIAAFTALLVLLAPTIWLNSAVWGQCDGLIALLVVLTVHELIRNHSLRAMLWYGLALSTKLQSIFVFPLFLWLSLRGKFALHWLLILPVVYIITILPAWLIGRPFSELLTVYFHQSQSYPNLTLGAPSFYALLNAEEAYSYLLPTGIVLCGIAVLIILRLGRNRRGSVDAAEILKIAFLFALLVPYLLPKMHERYFFTADVLSFPLAATNKRYFYVPFIMQLCSSLSYLPYLFGKTTLQLPILALILGALTIWMVAEVVREHE